jgi:phospholipid/cholesterol/gamma-HCH transport system substrate-binding protein
MSRHLRVVAGLLLAVLVATGCNLQLLGAPGGSLKLHATFADVEGLVVGNSVQINNVVVGSVTNVTLDRKDHNPYRALVEMSIDSGRRVPSDASATIQQTTLLGEYYVDIVLPPQESPTAHVLRSGESVGSTSTSPPVEQVVAKAGELLSAVNANDVSTIITAGSDALTGRGPQLHDLINKSAQLLAAFSAQRQEIGTAVDNLGKLGSTLAPLSGPFSQLLDSVESATTLLTKDRDRFFTALENFDQLINTTNDVVITPHAAQFTQLITEVNTILGALSNNTRILSDLADNLASATPRFTRVVSKSQVLLALWAELPRFK